MTTESVIHSDPDILSGTPVFVGTRVPAKTLLDYIEGGHTLDKSLFIRDMADCHPERSDLCPVIGVRVSLSWTRCFTSFSLTRLLQG